MSPESSAALDAPRAVAGALRETARAKLNLALHVRGKRRDGYHELDTLVAFTEVGDELELLSSAHAADFLTVGGPFAGPLRDAVADNLVLRAARGLGTVHGKPPVGLQLTKTLPVAAGLGGGSADAAATLRLLCRAWGIEPATDRLQPLAVGLGADVPMCLRSRPLIARGRGELIDEVPDFPALAVVLVHPGVAVSTGQVFSRLDAPDDPPLPPLPERFDTVADFVRWLRPTRNGLADAARDVAPVIGNALQALSNVGAMFARMSGSGASCFGIFPFRDAAEHAARVIRGAEPGWWVVATSTGPS